MFEQIDRRIGEPPSGDIHATVCRIVEFNRIDIGQVRMGQQFVDDDVDDLEGRSTGRPAEGCACPPIGLPVVVAGEIVDNERAALTIAAGGPGVIVRKLLNDRVIDCYNQFATEPGPKFNCERNMARRNLRESSGFSETSNIF